MAEYTLGLEAEIFVGGGGKLAGSMSFDTESLEISMQGTAALGGGVGVGAGIIAERAPSSGRIAEDKNLTSTSLEVSGNVLFVNVSKETTVSENGKSVLGEAGQSAVGVTKDVKTPGVEGRLKPQLKFGGSATVNYNAQRRSAAIPQAINEVKRGATQIRNAIACLIGAKGRCAGN